MVMQPYLFFSWDEQGRTFAATCCYRRLNVIEREVTHASLAFFSPTPLTLRRFCTHCRPVFTKRTNAFVATLFLTTLLVLSRSNAKMQNSFFIVFECHAFIANRNFARNFLNNGFRLQKTNRAAIRWKQPPAKPFHHVSRDKKLRHSWIIPAALARGFSDLPF